MLFYAYAKSKFYPPPPENQHDIRLCGTLPSPHRWRNPSLRDHFCRHCEITLKYLLPKQSHEAISMSLPLPSLRGHSLESPHEAIFVSLLLPSLRGYPLESSHEAISMSLPLPSLRGPSLEFPHEAISMSLPLLSLRGPSLEFPHEAISVSIPLPSLRGPSLEFPHEAISMSLPLPSLRGPSLEFPPEAISVSLPLPSLRGISLGSPPEAISLPKTQIRHQNLSRRDSGSVENRIPQSQSNLSKTTPSLYHFFQKNDIARVWFLRGKKRGGGNHILPSLNLYEINNGRISTRKKQPQGEKCVKQRKSK